MGDAILVRFMTIKGGMRTRKILFLAALILLLGAGYDKGGSWAGVVTSYLYAEADGTLTRVEAGQTDVTVARYSPNLELISQQTLALELPLYGGFFHGERHNFLIFGQENPAEDDAVEVIRVVKYTHDWVRVGDWRLYGGNTAEPFTAGSLRCAESGGILHIRTCHKMYKTEDGVNHQANLMLSIRTADMTLTNSLTGLQNRVYGYVSHSFNQFLAMDGERIIALDHGDAFPRSVVLFRYPEQLPAGGDYGRAEYVELLPISGPVGQNATGVTVGGLAVTDHAYLTVGTTVDQQAGDHSPNAQRNVYLTVTRKTDFTAAGTELIFLTDHEPDSGVRLGNPQIADVGAGRYLVIWSEDSGTCWVLVDENGKRLGAMENSGELHRSDCQPIRWSGKLIWYVNDGAQVRFMTIDPGFADVDREDYFWEPVRWATDQGIVRGVSDTCFGPDAICTRAQMVTFLWRAWGCPEPEGRDHPFRDIPESAYYESAVLWALEQGITRGVSDDRFDPDGACTRAQAVTFLWRLAGMPTPAAQNAAFTDLELDEYYVNPILWAAEQGITQGMGSGTFGINVPCTRAQMVTFLHRTLGP